MAKTIDDYKKDWQLAHDAGDKAGMDAAHAAAEALRAKAGFSGGVDGSEYIPLATTPGAPSGFQGSATGVNTFTNAQKSIQEQMNENSKQWWVADAAGREALHAKNEELSKLLGGGVAYDPSSGTWSGNAAPVSETSTQIDSLLNAILNREPFSYDHTTDPTYLAYEDKYKRLGDRAREDTLGDVAGLTGGLPSSWAVSAASQAQNDYNQQLSDVIPTLYDAAYNRYLNEDSLKRSDLGLIMDVDNMKYGRERDKVADSKWQQEFDYGKDRDKVYDDQWQQEFDYTKDKDKYNRLMDKWAMMGVADEEVAAGLGVDLHATTESYEFNKLSADRAAANDQFDREKYYAELNKENAENADAEQEQKYLEGTARRNAQAFLEDGRPDDAAMAILSSGVTSATEFYRIGEELGIRTSILDSVFDEFYNDALKGDPVTETRTKTSWKNAALASEDPIKFLQDNAAKIDADGVDWGALLEEVMNLQALIN